MPFSCQIRCDFFFFLVLVSMGSTNMKSSSIAWFYRVQLAPSFGMDNLLLLEGAHETPSQLKGETKKGPRTGQNMVSVLPRPASMCCHASGLCLNLFYVVNFLTPSPGSLVLIHFIVNNIVFILIHSENIDRAAGVGQALSGCVVLPSRREEHLGQHQ